jgi:carboxyl-terminal processing protease
MFKKIRERKLHLLLFTFMAGLFLGINLSFAARAEDSAHAYLDYFHQVYQIIRTEYVDTVDTKTVFYGAIKGMIQALNDPFSRFLDEDSYTELKEETTGKFVGIGVEISARDGEIVVVSPIADTPAMRAGLKAGDVITRVNGIDIKDKNLSEIVKMIRGLPHTAVKLMVAREGFDEPLSFEIERASIKIETVSFDILKEYNTGYIKIKTFSTDTTREVENAVQELNRKGITKLIVDLRWNPGGLLDKAISISELFLDKGRVIVSTRGREGSGTIREYSSEKTPLYKGQLAVLVNKGSASASEIFSGAIKDNNRGKLVGEKTFGKGSVQKFFNLNENIGVTLTIAKYYTPSGVSIHGKGIMPDHAVIMESFPESDRKSINLILKEKLVEAFVKTHKGYNVQNRQEFMQFLKEKNLNVSEQSANYLLKSEIYKFSKQPVYDLEFDTQLKKALEVVNEKL